MFRNSLRSGVEWALMVALVLGVGAVAQAEEKKPADGPVIQIGKGDVEEPQLPLRPRSTDGAIISQPEQSEAPKYWIGLLGGTITPDNPLRAHLDLPENQGLIVANVVPDGPAAKAGLKQHDILLRANDTDLHEMQDLVELVLSEGPKKGQITLEVLRHNKRETVYLTPEERPANAPVPQVDFNHGAGGEFEMPIDPQAAFGGQMPFAFRNFGNGMIGGGGEGMANMPNGVSMSVQKQEGQPTHITVKRGEETWEVVGDDPESLKQLPEDLRPFVERMVHGHGGMKIDMPNFDRRIPGPEFEDGRLRERLERMEQRLEEIQKRLSGEEHAEKSNEATK